MSLVELHPYKSIACADYEYIEIACMDGYTVDVVTDRQTIRGRAVTTQTNRRGEFFIIETGDGTDSGNNNGDDSAVRESIRVDHIRRIIVVSKKRRFNEHVFASNLAPGKTAG